MTAGALDWTLRTPLLLTKPEIENTWGSLGTPHLRVTILQNNLYLLLSQADGFHPQLQRDCLVGPSLLQSLNTTRLSGIFSPLPHSGQLSLRPVIMYQVYFEGPCPKTMVTSHLVLEHLATWPFPWLDSPWTDCFENYNVITVYWQKGTVLEGIMLET